jgi:two-component system chemotaxis response regulator CheY
VRKKVLVVDDSVTVRQQLRMALAPAGYEVIEAFDGEDGLAKALEMPDLAMAICDVNMPRMDGIEMITLMRERGLTVPIVMLTTEGQPDLIRKAKRAGAKGWIVKPFNVSLLVKAVDKLAS